MKAVADFLKFVLPPPLPTVQTARRQSTPTQTEATEADAAIPSTLSAAEIYEIPKSRPSEDDDDAVDDDADVAAGGFVEKDAQGRSLAPWPIRTSRPTSIRGVFSTRSMV